MRRRDCLKGCAALATTLGLTGTARAATAPVARRTVRFGLVADAHYADVDPRGSRCLRDSLAKLEQFASHMAGADVDFIVELGDLKDQDAPPVESRTLDYLRAAVGALAACPAPLHGALGNHDMDSLTKAQVLDVLSRGRPDARAAYSFDAGLLHGIVLDANFQLDGTAYERGRFNWTEAIVPAAQIEWLRTDLAATRGHAVVFIHQMLNGSGDLTVRNAAEVRAVLEGAGNVRAVFQGHHHPGHCEAINGIHYYTLRGMVEGPGLENNAYALAEMDAEGTLTVTGFGKATSRRLARPPAAGGTI